MDQIPPSDRNRIEAKRLKPDLVNVDDLWWFFLALIIAVAALLRCREYMFSQPLWLDEAMLANEVLGRSIGQLFRPLGGGQSAPLGFLLLVKLATFFLGNGERGLRFIPFVSSCFSVVVAAAVFTRMLPRWSSLFALAIFAWSSPGVYFAAEFKQYGFEALITLILLLSAIAFFDHPSRLRATCLIVAGGLSQVCSLPAPFVLAGIFVCLLYEARRTRSKLLLWTIFGACMSWTAVGVCNWLALLRFYAQSEFYQRFWSAQFMPWPMHQLSDLAWLPAKFVDLSRTLLGFDYQPVRILSALLVIVGILAIRRNPLLGLLAAGPLVLSALAGVLHRYPYFQRLQYFSTPLLCILLGLAASYLWKCASPALRLTFISAIFLLLAALISFIPAAGQKRDFPDLRWIIIRLAQTPGPKPVIYADETTLPLFLYYSHRLTPEYAFDVRSAPSSGTRTSDAGEPAPARDALLLTTSPKYYGRVLLGWSSADGGKPLNTAQAEVVVCQPPWVGQGNR